MLILGADDYRVHQSISILRYMAKYVGLAESNDWESLHIDGAAFLDVQTIIRRYDYNAD